MATDWMSIPLSDGSDTGVGSTPRPKYRTDTTVVVHHEGRAYVPVGPGSADRELLDHDDVYQLSEEELGELDDEVPYSLADLADQSARSRWIGLGDLIAAATTRLGISECAGCRKRRRWLNRIPVWRR